MVKNMESHDIKANVIKSLRRLGITPDYQGGRRFRRNCRGRAGPYGHKEVYDMVDAIMEHGSDTDREQLLGKIMMLYNKVKHLTS